jgi:hypothetical protein
MPFVVEKDETRNPLDLAILRAQNIMADAQYLVDLIEQAEWPGQWQFAQVEVQHLAGEEIQRVPAGHQGPHGVFLGMRHRFEELADLD